MIGSVPASVVWIGVVASAPILAALHGHAAFVNPFDACHGTCIHRDACHLFEAPQAVNPTIEEPEETVFRVGLWSLGHATLAALPWAWGRVWHARQGCNCRPDPDCTLHTERVAKEEPVQVQRPAKVKVTTVNECTHAMRWQKNARTGEPVCGGCGRNDAEVRHHAEILAGHRAAAKG
jgi:hypothetical protein